jgi:hypothetical protein
MYWWAVLGHSGISGLSLISWTGNLIEDKDNNQLRFENQNNCQKQISSTILYHKDKPNPELNYFLQKKSEYILLFCLCQINKSGF